MAIGSTVTLRVQSIVKLETSPVNISSYQIDAANLTAWNLNWTNFKAATDAIILGVLQHESIRIYDTLISAVMPVSNNARRELKLLVRYLGSNGKNYRMEVPTPDLAVLTLESGNANFVNIADAGVMAAWVVEFESISRAPDDDTVTVTVQSVQVVGRNI